MIKKVKKTLAILLALSMTMSMVSVTALAEEGEAPSGLCKHHTEHTAECGYKEAVPGAECTHECSVETGCVTKTTNCLHVEHTEACGGLVDPENCTHECSVETGCVTVETACVHEEHDTVCGFREAEDAVPCKFAVEGCPECREERCVAQIGETKYETLQAAIEAAGTDKTEVKLLKGTTENVVVGEGQDITLDLSANTLTGTGTGTVLTVNGGNVTLTGGGTITGGNTSNKKNGGGVYVGAGATFTLSDGTISGNTVGTSKDKCYGGGVYVAENGQFVMTGGAISENKSWVGGGVYVAKDSTFTMNGGTIARNEVYTLGDSGTGVTVYGEFEMSGGTISDHTTAGSGGGVLVMNGGQFTMSGTALITRNQGENGGGVCIQGAASAFTMNGGTISENITKDIDGYDGQDPANKWNDVDGGGVLVYLGTFTMNGGEITGNKAVGQKGGTKQGGSYGGGVSTYSSSGGTFIYNGGAIYNNTAETGGDDMIFYKNTKLTLCATGDWTLDGSSHKITGWYYDNSNNRWENNDARTKVTKIGEEMTLKGTVSLKAAHGNLVTVTYNTDGGGAVDAQTVESGSAAVRPTDPTRSGYTFSGWTLDGTAYDFATPVTGDITLVAQWTENYVPPVTTYYTLTINYVDAEGNTVADPYTRDLREGRSYSVTSPEVEGYTTEQTVVAVTLTGDLTVTVVYTAVEDIEDPDTPLVETPDVTETPEPSETPEPAETEEPETPDETEELEDPDTPLAEVPQTGDSLWLWLTLAVLSALGLAWIGLNEKKAGKRIV